MSTPRSADGPPGPHPSPGPDGRVRADELVRWLLADPTPVTAPPGDPDPDPLAWPGYPELRAEVRDDVGVDESVIVATGRLAAANDPSIEVVAVAWEFRFLGGSMGSTAGARIAAAYDLARERRLPVVLLPATGGARMQEGMASLVQMASTVVAAAAHAAAGLLSVAWLRDPTTGGVFASHANLADVVWAEPDATIGFAGPRVAAAMTGGELPDGSHTAQGAAAAGLVDDVVALADLPSRLVSLLEWATRQDHGQQTSPGRPPRREPGPDAEHADAWHEVQRSRDPGRPTAADHLAGIEVAAELRGDRSGAVDPTVRAVLGTLPDGARVVAIAMDRSAADGRPTPAGYRTAWRALALAGRLGVPVVTLIDTPGAAADAGAEAGGIAHHIARTFALVLAAPVPVVAVVIGEGGSGGALALAVGDRLVIQEHATFSVIAPEGAAAILHRDPARAPEVAELLRPTAHELFRLGIADEVVPEPVGREVATVWEAVVAHLNELRTTDRAELLERRAARWRTPLRTPPATESPR